MLSFILLYKENFNLILENSCTGFMSFYMLDYICICIYREIQVYRENRLD